MNRNAAWHRELVFDHAFILVNDLEAADARMRTEFGMGTVAGGTFPDYPGIVNRYVPMREGFLELLALTKRKPPTAEAQYWAERLETFGEHIAGWALRTDRLGEAAADLGLDVDGPERAMLEPGNFEVRWSVVWPDDDPPSMPFLIQWEDFESLRAFMDKASAEAEHERQPMRVEALKIGGSGIQEIVGRVGSPVSIEKAPGPDRVAALFIATTGGPIELRWEGDRDTPL